MVKYMLWFIEFVSCGHLLFQCDYMFYVLLAPWLCSLLSANQLYALNDYFLIIIKSLLYVHMYAETWIYNLYATMSRARFDCSIWKWSITVRHMTRGTRKQTLTHSVTALVLGLCLRFFLVIFVVSMGCAIAVDHTFNYVMAWETGPAMGLALHYIPVFFNKILSIKCRLKERKCCLSIKTLLPNYPSFWHDTDFSELDSADIIDYILEKSVSYQKKDRRGMITTKTLRSVFSWHASYEHEVWSLTGKALITLESCKE